MALKDNLVDMSKGWPAGFTPLDSLPDSSQGSNPAAPPVANPRMRTATPGTNADADLINQVGKGGSNPQFRMLPLPPATGGTTTVTTGGSSSSSSSSSGGGSSSSVSINPKTVTVSIPSLGPNSLVELSVATSQSFQLLSVAASNPCNVRLYGSAAAQISDASRSVDAPVPAELAQNIILDVVLDTNPYIWYCQNIIGANSNAPQNTTLFITVINELSTALSGTAITLTFVPLES
jgi:hypothetical protein